MHCRNVTETSNIPERLQLAGEHPHRLQSDGLKCRLLPPVGRLLCAIANTSRRALQVGGQSPGGLLETMIDKRCANSFIPKFSNDKPIRIFGIDYRRGFQFLSAACCPHFEFNHNAAIFSFHHRSDMVSSAPSTYRIATMQGNIESIIQVICVLQCPKISI